MELILYKVWTLFCNLFPVVKSFFVSAAHSVNEYVAVDPRRQPVLEAAENVSTHS